MTSPGMGCCSILSMNFFCGAGPKSHQGDSIGSRDISSDCQFDITYSPEKSQWKIMYIELVYEHVRRGRSWWNKLIWEDEAHCGQHDSLGRVLNCMRVEKQSWAQLRKHLSMLAFTSLFSGPWMRHNSVWIACLHFPSFSMCSTTHISWGIPPCSLSFLIPLAAPDQTKKVKRVDP